MTDDAMMQGAVLCESTRRGHASRGLRLCGGGGWRCCAFGFADERGKGLRNGVRRVQPRCAAHHAAPQLRSTGLVGHRTKRMQRNSCAHLLGHSRRQQRGGHLRPEAAQLAVRCAALCVRRVMSLGSCMHLRGHSGRACGLQHGIHVAVGAHQRRGRPVAHAAAGRHCVSGSAAQRPQDRVALGQKAILIEKRLLATQP